MSLNLSKANLVKLKNGAKLHRNTGTLVDFVVGKVTAIPDWQKLRADPELVRFTLEVLANGLQWENDEALVSTCEGVIARLFPDLSADERMAFSSTVRFLLANGLVQEVGCLRHCTKRVVRFFFPSAASKDGKK